MAEEIPFHVAFYRSYPELVTTIKGGIDGKSLTLNDWYQLANRTKGRFQDGELDYKPSIIVDAVTSVGVASGALADLSLKDARELAVMYVLNRDEAILKEIEKTHWEPAGGPADPLETTEEVKNSRPIQFIIDGYIPRNSLALLYGPPGCGKSFVALDIALTIQRGCKWALDPSLEVKQGQTLYLAFEGEAGFRDRIRAWEVYHGAGVWPEKSQCIFMRVPLFSTYGYDGASEMILESLHKRGIVPKLTVWDTLTQVLIGNENLVEDMNNFTSMTKKFKGSLDNCTQLIVHHSNAGQTKARGSTALPATCDTVLKIEKLDHGSKLDIEKVKDGYAAGNLNFCLITVLREDQGMIRSSCYPFRTFGGYKGKMVIDWPLGLSRTVAGLAAAYKVKEDSIGKTLRELKKIGLVTEGSHKNQWIRLSDPKD